MCCCVWNHSSSGNALFLCRLRSCDVVLHKEASEILHLSVGSLSNFRNMFYFWLYECRNGDKDASVSCSRTGRDKPAGSARSTSYLPSPTAHMCCALGGPVIGAWTGRGWIITPEYGNGFAQRFQSDFSPSLGPSRQHYGLECWCHNQATSSSLRNYEQVDSTGVTISVLRNMFYNVHYLFPGAQYNSYADIYHLFFFTL